MRKRPSRPKRFASVDNHAIDTLPSILSVGLLTRLIRSKDGDDVNVERLAADYEEGEKSLSKAMRALVNGAFVVKFKIQRAASEVIEEDGELVTKRGGSWYTTFSVDSIAFTAADVAEMVDEILAEGNVKAIRVEPERLDPRKRAATQAAVAASRPTPPMGGVGPTSDDDASDAKPQVRPTPPSPGVGQGGAHIRKKTSSARTQDSEDGEAPSGRRPVDGRSPSSTGSRRAREEGGSAAPSNTQPAPTSHTPRQPPTKSSSKAKHTRAQLDRVRTVRALYPAHLLHGWTSPDGTVSYGPLPDVPTLSQAILDALDGDVPAADRTTAQLGARIEQRWRDHGWADKFYTGAITSPVGAAIDMVRPLKGSDRYGCANPRCDAGKDVDTGRPCLVCPERIAARKAARRQAAAAPGAEAAGSTASTPTVPGPREHRPFRECPCREPIPKTSDDTLCPACRRAADEAEQDRQIREQLARQYGTPEQVAAYCGEPPF